MTYFNYNGKLFPEGTPVIGADNRGLRYGDGLFETMKFNHEKIILLNEHLNRLWAGLQTLGFELPAHFTREYLLAEIQKLLQKNNHGPARIRLSVVRGDGGLYDPENHHPNFIIQTWPIDLSGQAINTNGLTLGIYREVLKPCDQLSNLKHNSHLCYVMGALFAKKNKWNDALVLNQYLRVSDSTIANIFIVKDRKILTPPLSEGCIGGIMREYLLSQLPVLGFDVIENPLTEEILLNADEVFLTNSIYNIRWVSSIADKKYASSFIHEIIDVLLKTNDPVFC